MSYRILLAEDEPSLRNMTAEYLGGQGFTVDAVWNGEEAEWDVNQNCYDAVILDIMMPKKNGQDVCRTIRARYDVPVIFLTALNAEDVIVESYGIGADEYITKPFSADLSMIRTVLMNFLTNAARYSQSYISVTIAREKNHIRWSVKNDGTAIPEEDRNRVWDAFYTVDESRSKRKGGTGLGLAITKQILDLHKAKTGCTGNATETEFFFEMPEVVEVAEEETAE